MNNQINNRLAYERFIGKTYNNHPDWFNKPLRLSKEETERPMLAVDEFFQCYHLEEVRELLWNWLVEVISSHNSISADHRDRNNHIFFYEKMEALVEASFVMRKNVQKHL